jgi:hypothetical protein
MSPHPLVGLSAVSTVSESRNAPVPRNSRMGMLWRIEAVANGMQQRIQRNGF